MASHEHGSQTWLHFKITESSKKSPIYKSASEPLGMVPGTFFPQGCPGTAKFGNHCPEREDASAFPSDHGTNRKILQKAEFSPEEWAGSTEGTWGEGLQTEVPHQDQGDLCTGGLRAGHGRARGWDSWRTPGPLDYMT